MTATTEATLDRAVGSISRALAQRITRRSAVSKLGRYGVALSLGAAGVTLLDDRAKAATISACCQSCRGGCCNCDSFWCGLGGSCPSYTCRCGAWWAGCKCSNGAKLMYGDCCGGCNCGNFCNCGSGDCNNGPCNQPGGCSPCPGCCHQFQHNSDTGRACGDCSTCSCPWYVNCRRAFCQ